MLSLYQIATKYVRDFSHLFPFCFTGKNHISPLAFMSEFPEAGLTFHLCLSVASWLFSCLSFSLGQEFLDRKEFSATILSSKPSTTVITRTVLCQGLYYARIITSDLVTKCNNFISY